ncbi:GNAT family N-acetyltransferase [Companilactobacillus kedongensis]|uniref:GNAT family N-acetyltransferase n=1 Tax=Companilactobacillus kedongensis TaxID=2486004 RepID=UPI000F7A8701|nr:GNAT family N-acetyltransferase [Companilactobacillus kedongensis]
MNFNRYTDSKTAEKLYAEYFVRDAWINSTVALAAYEDDQLCGAIMTRFKNEVLLGQSILDKIYVDSFQQIIGMVFDRNSYTYEQVNQAMLEDLQSKISLDGEITLFAVDPARKDQGIGSKLLKSLEQQFPEKQVYLFTDSNCSYQFYQHRNFEQFDARRMLEPGRKSNEKMTCFLFNKKL